MLAFCVWKKCIVLHTCVYPTRLLRYISVLLSEMYLISQYFCPLLKGSILGLYFTLKRNVMPHSTWLYSTHTELTNKNFLIVTSKLLLIDCQKTVHELCMIWFMCQNTIIWLRAKSFFYNKDYITHFKVNQKEFRFWIKTLLSLVFLCYRPSLSKQ